MSVDITTWQTFRQQGGVCILASYGLALAALTGQRPEAIVADYAMQRGILASPPTTVDHAAACAFGNQQAAEGLTGYALMQKLHNEGPGQFALARSQCSLRPFDVAGKGFEPLAAALRAEVAVAMVCVNLPHEAHSIAVAADGVGRLWRNDPNGTLLMLNGEESAAVLEGFGPSAHIGDVFILSRGLGDLTGVISAVPGSIAR